MFAVTQVTLLVVIELCVVVGLAMAAARWQQHQRQLRAEIDQHRDGVLDSEVSLGTHAPARVIEITHEITHDTADSGQSARRTFGQTSV
jgi:hypothetical protein